MVNSDRTEPTPATPTDAHPSAATSASGRPDSMSAWVAGLAVVVLAAVLVMVAVAIRPSRAGWDPEVWDVAQNAAKARGLSWEKPVPARTLTGDEFAGEVTGGEQSDESSDELADGITWLAAAGMLAERPEQDDVLDAVASGGVLAYYDPTSETITLRSGEGDLNVGDKVVLAHELVHALQDQHYDLDSLLARASDDESGALTFLIEGDAVNTERTYYELLPRAQRRAWELETGGEGAIVTDGEAAELEKSAAEIPTALGMFLAAPYELGTLGVRAARAVLGDSEVESFFRHPPETEAAFLSISQLGNRDATTAPDLTLRGNTVAADSDGQTAGKSWRAASATGAFGVAMTVAGLDDPTVVTAVIDSWRGGSSWVHDTTTDADLADACVAEAVDLRGDRAAVARAALRDVAALRGGVATTKGSVTSFSMCPDGSEYTAAELTEPYLTLLFRLEAFVELIDSGADVDVAACMAEGLVDAATIKGAAQSLASGELPDLQARAAQVAIQRAFCETRADRVGEGASGASAAAVASQSPPTSGGQGGASTSSNPPETSDATADATSEASSQATSQATTQPT